MKLKLLKSVAHSTAASYMSTMSLTNGKYTATALYRAALISNNHVIEIDVLNKSIKPSLAITGIDESLNRLHSRFQSILETTDIPLECVSDFKLCFEVMGNRRDVVHFSCTPVIVDVNGKTYRAKPVFDIYPEPV